MTILQVWPRKVKPQAIINAKNCCKNQKLRSWFTKLMFSSNKLTKRVRKNATVLFCFWKLSPINLALNLFSLSANNNSICVKFMTFFLDTDFFVYVNRWCYQNFFNQIRYFEKNAFHFRNYELTVLIAVTWSMKFKSSDTRLSKAFSLISLEQRQYKNDKNDSIQSKISLKLPHFSPTI